MQVGLSHHQATCLCQVCAGDRAAGGADAFERRGAASDRSDSANHESTEARKTVSILRDYTPNTARNGEDIVRPAWRHADLIRNGEAPVRVVTA